MFIDNWVIGAFMTDRTIQLRDLILTPEPVKLYGGLTLIGAAIIGMMLLVATLLEKPVNYPGIITAIGYVGFMFLRVYISRNHPPTRERLQSAHGEEAWAVMSGGNAWGIPAFAVLALLFYLTWRGFSG